MSFTDKLHNETKASHTIVDKHPFVSLIRKDKRAGKMYIDFNKMCIQTIQSVLKLNDNQLLVELYRDIEGDIEEYVDVPALNELLNHCKKYPLESAYQFYLGLLFGGNMLKRMLPEAHDFLTYDNPKELIHKFKKYLCDNVTILEQEIFINNVNTAYKLIKQLFDEFYNKFT